MASKNRYFVRVDSKGAPVQGSNINRAKKPVSNGIWIEIDKLDCCGKQLTIATGAFPASGSTVTLKITCSAVDLIKLVFTASYANVYELVGILNDKAGYLGYFTVNAAAGIDFQVKSKVVDGTCNNLTFDID